MRSLEELPYLRACVDGDDTFLYDVFCTTWESEVAALPNPKLAQHVSASSTSLRSAASTPITPRTSATSSSSAASRPAGSTWTAATRRCTSST